MNGNDSHNHEEQPRPQPNFLLPNATATIFFDGLIYTAYNSKKKLYQAAVHTQAEEHQLTIRVRLLQTGQVLFPTAELPWEPAHETVKARAPFWLYVDSGGGLQPNDFSAQLYLPPKDVNDVRSFDRILNFERLYDRKITLNTNKFAEFNFPHGTCYSALNTDAELLEFPQNGSPTNPTSVSDINVSTLGAIDIDSVSNDQGKKEIVLANKDGKFFSFPLEQGKHYIIELINGPTLNHPHPRPEDHFLQFYELFPLQRDDPKFLVEPAESQGPPPAPGAPPCIQGTGGKQTGLP